MTTATLNASMTRLDDIKGKKHLYNKSKIAEAEALAAEALRMANEAKLAAARLAEVKKTLSMFSRKLAKAEQSVHKDIKLETVVPVAKKVAAKKEEPAVVKVPVEEYVKEEPVEEEPVVESPVEEPAKEEAVEEIPAVETPVEEPAKEEAVDETAVVESSVEEPVVVEALVEESVKIETVDEPTIVEEVAKEECVEEIYKADPPTVSSGVVSRNLFNNTVVKVVEFKQLSPVTAFLPAPQVVTQAPQVSAPRVVTQAPQVSAPRIVTQAPQVSAPRVVSRAPQVSAPRVVTQAVVTRETPALVAQQTYETDIIEDFLDSLGVDKMCGVDDNTLGFQERPVRSTPPKVEAPFENPTRIEYKLPLNKEQIFLHSTSWREELANHQRQELQLPPKNYQRAPVNADFSDPFGVDHDDLVFCGKLADLCEPPVFDDQYTVPDHFQEDYNRY